ncbi:putative cytochrome c550 [Azoarcus olearius]|uniref:c-type cytochrome n=1 Tax=Azoarcus sp. (strain BH72) TaxID=418699 RepID=UPI0008061215|nr:c-type cytochrome [Azoarcus olearius]ANQ86137.1 putative cytochrome c550 [Azoarcus olearius]
MKPHPSPTAWRRLLGAALLAAALPALALDAQRPQVDASALAPQHGQWQADNPYRGDPRAAEIGRSAFNQACAPCHGADADGHAAPAPDLRRLGRSCTRIADDALRQRCQRDVDHYFVSSVLKGKVKVGVVHMPAWDGVLEPELVWALRSFVESSGTPKGD